MGLGVTLICCWNGYQENDTSLLLSRERRRSLQDFTDSSDENKVLSGELERYLIEEEFYPRLVVNINTKGN